MVRQRHVPLRRCVACGTQRPKKELVHIVRTLHGEVVVDLGEKAAGRGAYLCYSAACWDKGFKRNRLEHSLKTQISAQNRQRLLELGSALVQRTSPGE